MTSNGDSPVRSIKNVLSLKRQSRDDVSSTNSGSKSPRRNSNDSTMNKLKSIMTHSGNDDAELSDGKRSKSLLGFAKLKEKVRRKSQAVDSQEELRGRDVDPKQTGSDANLSERSSILNDEGSSLLVSEYESEMPLEKPPLVNHPSHIGYLTSSSPQIKAVVVPVEPLVAQENEKSTTKLDRLLGKSLKMPKSRSPSISPSRSVSNGAGSNMVGPALTSSTGDIGQINSLQSQAKKDESIPSSTIAARRQTRGSDASNLPALQLAKTLTNKSNDSIPSIVTIPDTPPHSVDNFTAIAPPMRATTVMEDYSHRPLAAKSLASHRRIRSDGPPTSKLSQSMAPPLTPLEEARTPIGSRNPSGSGNGGGFFSSVFSVAQNAANTLTNTLQTNTRPKTSASNKSSAEKLVPLDQEETLEVSMQEPIRPLAIETLGSGDLSLDHLGINTESPARASSPTPSMSQSNGDMARSRSNTVIHNEQASAKAEGESAARAVSAAYSIVRSSEPAITPMAEDVSTPKPRQANTIDIVAQEEKAPMLGGIFDETATLTRSGSIRSKIERTRKRHRNSSGATVGVHITPNYSALGGSTASRFSGFNKANARRNKDFHNFFRSVPDDDDLIEDYSCALQRDIILAGRIYISEGHVCFSSNILGWVTNLVISFDEIVSVEKESTAMLFANAIAIQTLHARHTFRSLLSRDATYDLIVSIWRLNHPGLESSPVKTHRILNGGDNGSEGSLNSNGLDEETDSDESRSFIDSIEASVNGEEPVLRKVSALVTNSIAQIASPTFTVGNTSEKLASSVGSLGEYPGPSTHGPTECNDTATHLDKLLKDDVIPAPLGKVYSLLFGSASTAFLSRWLQDEIRVTDLQVDDNKALLEAKQTRTITYIKPLANPIGPRTTKCIITEHLDLLDLEKAVIVSVTTQTPDVPSGNLFSTKTKYCLMWGPSNSTRIIMTHTIEWIGKSWLKGPIEKGATDGQTAYANDLVKVLKSGVSSRGRSVTQGSKGRKLRKHKSEGSSLKESASSKTSAWAPLQLVYNSVDAVIRRVKPLFSVYSIIVVLLFLLTVTWFGNSRVRHTRSLFPGSRIGADSKIPYASRIAAWEDTWLSEEEALWEWLQDRTGLAEGFSFPVPSSSGHESRVTPGSTSFSTRSRKRSTNNRDLQWAIKITEDRLALLKQKSGSSQNIKGTPKQSYPPIAHDSVQLTEQEANDVESLLNQVVGSR